MNKKEYKAHIDEAKAHLEKYGNHSLSPWWFDKFTPKELTNILTKTMSRPVKVRVATHEIPVLAYGIPLKNPYETYWIAECK